MNKESYIETTNNPESKALLAVKVVSAAMKAVKENCATLLKHADLNFEELYKIMQWVICAPVIWTASTIQLMREAAYDVRAKDNDSYLFNIIIIGSAL